MVGVFNLCRARPRQMIMGRVVPPSPAILAILASVASVALLFSLSTGWADAGRAKRRDTADAVEES